MNISIVIASLGLTIYMYLPYIPYCPRQAPMGARSSSTKIWRWAVTRRRCLNGSTIPAQEPTLDVKLAAMGLNWLASSVCFCFIKASPTVEKAISCYKADRLVASLQSFHTSSRRLQYANFVLQGRTLQTRPWKGVCEPDVMAPKAHQNNRSYVSLADLPSDSLRKNLAWWAVTQRTLKYSIKSL